jgi:hypothetical protein
VNQQFVLALPTVVPPVLEPPAPIVPLDEPSVDPELPVVLPPVLEPMELLPPVLEPGVLLPVVPLPDAMVPPVLPRVEPVAAPLLGVVVPELPIALVLLPLVPPVVLPLVPAVFTQPGLPLALGEGVVVEGVVVDGVVVDEPSVPEADGVGLVLLLLLPVCAVATPAMASDAAAAMVQSLRVMVMRVSFVEYGHEDRTTGWPQAPFPASSGGRREA